MTMANQTSTSLNPKTHVYLKNILHLLVVTSITLLMPAISGVCRSVLVFYQVKNIELY